MRVAVVASFAPSLIKFRRDLLQTMVAEGWEVHAFAPDPTPTVIDTLQRWKVSMHTYPLNRQGIHPVQDLKTLQNLAYHFKKLRPDAVLAYTAKPVVWGMLAAAWERTPRRIAWITGLGAAFTPPFNAKKLFIRTVLEALYRLALPWAHRVVVQNPDDAAVVSRWVSPRKIAQVPGSGVDLEKFQPAAYPHQITFLMLSRLIADKGVREYAEAARQIKRQHPEVRFLLAGWLEPNYPGSVSADELAHWQEEGVLEYLGALDDVRPAIAQASVYVLPSYREGTPRSVLEAMAMARPVITTDASGCRQTVHPGENGLLVPVRNPQALAEAMRFFIQHPEMIPRMGKASRQLAEKVFDSRNVTARLIDLLRS